MNTTNCSLEERQIVRNGSGPDISEAVCVKHDEDNTSLAQRQAICARWRAALEDVKLEARLKIPKQNRSIDLVGPAPVAGTNRIEIAKEVDVSFSLFRLGKDFGSPQSIPAIEVWVCHNADRILQGHDFERRVSASISAALGNQVILRVAQRDSQEDFGATMECVDAESSWILADFILHARRYRDVEGTQTTD